MGAFHSCHLRAPSSTGKLLGAAMCCRAGDYISPHNDVTNNRVLSLVLSLSKGWERQYGAT